MFMRQRKEGLDGILGRNLPSEVGEVLAQFNQRGCRLPVINEHNGLFRSIIQLIYFRKEKAKLQRWATGVTAVTAVPTVGPLVPRIPPFKPPPVSPVNRTSGYFCACSACCQGVFFCLPVVVDEGCDSLPQCSLHDPGTTISTNVCYYASIVSCSLHFRKQGGM